MILLDIYNYSFTILDLFSLWAISTKIWKNLLDMNYFLYNEHKILNSSQVKVAQDALYLPQH